MHRAATLLTALLAVPATSLPVRISRNGTTVLQSAAGADLVLQATGGTVRARSLLSAPSGVQLNGTTLTEAVLTGLLQLVQAQSATLATVVQAQQTTAAQLAALVGARASWCSALDDPAQCAALVAFANATSYRSVAALNPPNIGTTYCAWPGVTCGGPSGGDVVALSLTSIAGRLPAELGSLTYLTSLSLVGGPLVLSGSIPASLGNLTRLTYLNLGSNGLTGTLPSTLSSLTRLTYLSVAGNALLAGSFPMALTNVTSLVSYSTNVTLPSLTPGEMLFKTVGTTNWTVPSSAHKTISIVCVGGGGGGSIYSVYATGAVYATGGGGGALTYVNNVSVIPGSTVLTVVIGAEGTAGSSSTAGGNSSIAIGGTAVLIAAGGLNGTNGGGGAGGSPSAISGTVSFAGGVGGYSGWVQTNPGYYGTTTFAGGSGGGAGGYAGAGGAGGSGHLTPTISNPATPSLGGGGGGGGACYFPSSYSYPSSSTGSVGTAPFFSCSGAPGGGVGLLGYTANGTAGPSTVATMPTSAGGAGSGGDGSTYGGGGGGGSNTARLLNGGQGACRVIWGPGRSFPYAAGAL